MVKKQKAAAPARGIPSIRWDGKKITKPGVYAGIPLDVYHSQELFDGPSVSSSGLRKIFNESPAHFFDEWSGNPNRKEAKDKRHFVLGRAVHHVFLGEPFFAKLFCVQPEEYADAKTGEMKKWTYNAGVCKAWRDEMTAAGRSILLASEVANIRGMALRLGQNPLVRDGLLNGQIERSIFWRDEQTGIWVKVRPDAIPTDSGDFADLKTTTSVRWTELTRAIAEYGYHQQGALIREAARRVCKIERPTFTLCFIEKESPWCERVVQIKDADLDRGEKQNRVALDLMADCLKAGRWPGPGGDREDAAHIEMPEWAQKQIDNRLQYALAD